MAKKPKKKPEPPQPLGFRLLHKRSHRGYTDDPRMAMFPDVGEAPDEFDQQRFDADAKARREAERMARRQAEELLPLEQRIAVLQREAKRRRVDIRSELRLIDKLKREGRPTESPVRSICVKLDKDLAA